MIKELENITNLILTSIKPVAIILFGSAKNFTLNPGSDVDICVLVESKTGLRNISKNLYKILKDFPFPIDIIVENADSFKNKSEFNNLIYKEISEGVVLYGTK